MIKILILLAIVVLSGMLGMLLSGGKKRRAKTFQEFFEFNEGLLLNLKYGKFKVREIYEKYPIVKRAFESGEFPDGEDGQFIKAYVSHIGTTDALSQIDYLNERREQLAKLRDESGENYAKYSSLYVKICLLAGILLAVLLA